MVENEDFEEARRLVDVFLRPFYEQPFEIGTDVELVDGLARVPFYYASEGILGHALVDTTARTVTVEGAVEEEEGLQ